MGTWAELPWDNDSAADWYGDLMDKCKIRDEWLNGMNVDCNEDPEVVRAAIGLFILLGRVYIWPIKNYDSDLELSISKAKELLSNDALGEFSEIIELIKNEIIELETRRKGNKGPGLQKKNKWWKIW